MQQPSESRSDRLLPRFDALVKPAFLSIAGSISAFIFAAYFYAGNSNVDFGWLVSLLYGNIGSVLLAYSIVALVTRVHRRLWGFFIVLYSILEGILGLFLVGYPYAYYAQPYGTPSAQNPYETLITILALVAPIVGLIGGLLGAVWPISSGQAKVGTTQPTGTSLVVDSPLFPIVIVRLLCWDYTCCHFLRGSRPVSLWHAAHASTIVCRDGD